MTAGLSGRRPDDTGFRIIDQELFTWGDTLTLDDYTLRRNGKPEPVIGTPFTWATVHRRFLLRPGGIVVKL